MYLTHSLATPDFSPSYPLQRALPPGKSDPAQKTLANALALAQSVARLLAASEARACERLHAISAAWAVDGPAAVAALRDRLGMHCARFEALEQFASETARRATEAWCDQAYALSLIRITRMPPRRPLLERAAPRPLEAGDPAELQLRMALVRRFRVTLRQGDPYFGDLLRAVLRFLRRRQAILCIAAEARHDLDHHLGADAAARAFTAAFDELPGSGAARGLPDLLADLQNILAMQLHVDAESLVVTDCQ
jgi:hypothetical protein